jgi:hypothetical protein
MRIARTLGTLAVAASLLIGNTGCIKKTLLKGQIQGTRQASSAVDTVHDYEVARGAAFGGLAQFEGMHKLAPDNADGLFLLTKGWAGSTFAFIEDDMEMAEDMKNRDMAEYHKQRALAGYDRAVNYGIDLLTLKAEGWDKVSKNDGLLRSWLKENFTDKQDAQDLLWVGYSWIAKVNIGKDDPDLVGNLFVGVALVERSVELDPEYAYGQGLLILAAYHARTALAELDQSEQLFNRAMAMTQNRALIQKFNYATKLLCAKSDKAGYIKALQEIVDAGDTLPEQRLQNAIAKRKARRYLGKARMEDARENCGFPD